MHFINNINCYINQAWLKKIIIIWPHPKYVEIYTQKFVSQILFVIIIIMTISIVIMLKIVLLHNFLVETLLFVFIFARIH